MRDKQLMRAGCQFLPWPKNALPRYDGKVILIVGEAHYNPERKHANNQFTREVIQKSAIRAEGRGKLYFKKIRQLFGTRGSQQDNPPVRFWESVFFYNYVQRLLREGRCAPSKQEWESGGEAFKAVLKELQPDGVVVTGKRLWQNMRKHLCVEENFPTEDLFQTTNLEKKTIFAPVMHPSAPRFKLKDHQPPVRSLLKAINAEDPGVSRARQRRKRNAPQACLMTCLRIL